MIENLRFILDVLWTVVKIGGAICLILFFTAVGIELIDVILEHKND